MISEKIAATLDRTAAATLSSQIYEIIRQLILNATLQPEVRLPSSRQLAADLSVARNTIIEAYSRLSDEGYLVNRVGAGAFVASTLPEIMLHAAGNSIRTPLIQFASSINLSQRGNAVINETAIDEGGAFAPCAPELGTFPFVVWQRLMGKAWRQLSSQDTQYAKPGGHPALRAAIATHVQLTRQVHCTAAQIVIVNGAQHGLDLCARLLADAGETVWVEDPGYPAARRAFRAADLALLPVPVDEEGMAPSALHRRTPPRLIYITPSHQFPTGVVMSLQRRLELLDAAADCNSWIIEDDYDGEFRFSGRPIASLQGIANGQRVIYLGSFSKTLFPGLRLGYLVLPESISERFAYASAQLGFEGRQVMQSALAAFIQEGYFAAHIRRMRILYAQRRKLLVQVWQSALGELASISGEQAGLHLIADLPAGTDQTISRIAREQGIMAQALSGFFVGEVTRSGLVLGYAAVHDREIQRQGKLLAQIVKQCLSET